MTTVDNRIVNMQFNNSSFENGIKSSLKSLNDLKNGLKLHGAANSLSDLSRAATAMNLGGIANGVDQISARFSNLGIIGVTALQNITNSAINAGKSMISSLTIDPIMSGFDEYETKMNSIQTILTNTASKGTTMADVTATLDELNTYSDQTIYNFAEMTRNIGTFTAAGIDLKTSATSIKGIANLAAGSGSNAIQASTAMYQLSQALAAGSVKLMDWNSVVNAGMGGELFKNALVKTAKEMGVFVDETKPFRETLEQGWLTSDVLTKTLSKFAEDESLIKAATEVKTFTQLLGTMQESVQSGWATSWEAIIGDKEEAAALFTSINDAFGNFISGSTEARNAALKFWNANGGREALIEGITNVLNALSVILKPITKGFDMLLPKLTGERLLAFSIAFRDLTSIFKIGEESSEKVTRSFAGLAAVFNIGKTAVMKIYTALKEVAQKILPPLGESFLSTAASIGDFLVSLDEAIRVSGIFTTIASTIGAIVGTIAGGIKYLATSILSMFNGVAVASAATDEMVEPLADFGNTVNEVTTNCEMFADKVKKAFAKVKEAFSSTFNFSFSNFQSNLNNILKTGLLILAGKLAWDVGSFVKNIGKVAASFSEVLEGVSDTLKAFQTAIKANVIKTIAISIAILAASLLVISLIDQEKLAKAFGTLTALFVMLFASMSMFTGIKGDIALIPIFKLTVGMIGLSIAVLILASALRKLSTLEWEQLAKGIVGVGAVMGGLILVMKYGQFEKLGVFSAIGILILAAALNVMANAVKKFAEMDPKELAKGLLGIGVALTEFVLFTKYVGNSKTVTYAAISLLLLGTALKVLASAVRNMGTMKFSALVQGLLAMAGALIILTVAFRFMPKSMALNAVALFIVSGAMYALAGALFLFSKVPVSGIVKGLGALAGVFLIMAIAGTVLAPLAPALLILSGAILLLGVGLLAAGAGLLAFAMGLGALVAVAAVSMSTISALITMVIEMIPLLLTNIAKGIVEFARVIGEGAPVIGQAFVSIITSMAQSVTTSIPQILTIFLNLIRDILRIILVNIPEFIHTGCQLVIKFIEGISKNIADVVVAGVTLILNFIAGITSKLGDIVQAAFDMLITFINAFADAIDKNSTAITGACVKLVTAIINALLKLMFMFPEIGINMIEGLIKGVAGMAKRLADTAVGVVQGAIKAAKSVLGMNSPSRVFNDIGILTMAGFVNGIASMGRNVKSSSEKIGKTAIDSMKNAISGIPDILNSDIDMAPTIRPVIDLTDITAGAKSINSLMARNQNLNVTAVAGKASVISRNIPESDPQLVNAMQKTLNDLKNVLEGGDHVISHTGEITVRGINNEDELIAVTKIVAKEFANGNRRIPTRVAVMPSLA